MKIHLSLASGWVVWGWGWLLLFKHKWRWVYVFGITGWTTLSWPIFSLEAMWHHKACSFSFHFLHRTLWTPSEPLYWLCDLPVWWWSSHTMSISSTLWDCADPVHYTGNSTSRAEWSHERPAKSIFIFVVTQFWSVRGRKFSSCFFMCIYFLGFVTLQRGL